MTFGWPEVTIGDVADPVDRSVSPEPGVTYRQIGVRLWGVGAYERESIDGVDTNYKSLNRTKRGDIIVNKIWARNGSVSVVLDGLQDCYCSGEFPLFRPRVEDLDPKWFYWITKTRWFWSRCDAEARGTSGKNRIRPERFLAIHIPLPPIDEQRRMVAKIERLAAKVEEARKLREQTELVARRLWEAGSRALLKEIPSNQWQPLGDLVEVGGGGTPSKKNPAFWGGSIPWVSPKDMKSRMIEDSQDHITGLAIEESSAKLHPADSVLIVVRGMILAHTVPVGLLRVPATVNQDMKALRTKRGLRPEYLLSCLWALNSSLVAEVEKSTHDTRKLTTGNLLAFRVPYPPEDEQERLLKQFRTLREATKTLDRTMIANGSVIDALLPSILDKAFKGEL